ncbi:hypothetical protein J5N97_020599 [Dioscorea zingiberensis]|uniref:Uncharacterized protein n=1 Tax=Dioscorea zingiberensis TaxID=325984 RepID=A0A9D5CIB8_9LILI|nr:hypothetical protein J5N97_020599 [Dioscorea zingiberensis]
MKSNAFELVTKHDSKIVHLEINYMDLLKGIGFKFLTMERLLGDHPALCVQIANPAHSHSTDMQRVQKKTHSSLSASWFDYDAAVLIDGRMRTLEKVAYYAIVKCSIINFIFDDLNLVPYKLPLLIAVEIR